MRSYKTALVLGLGASGEAAARLLLGEGTDVVVIDRRDDAALRQRAEALVAIGAVVILGRPELPRARFSVCVASPGIPFDSLWIEQLKERGVKVISELELGWSRSECRVLAVTGSNGKSTLVQLCAESLGHAGLHAVVAGNYEDRVTGQARPVSMVVRDSRPMDWLVLEVSSFQLERTSEFRPDVGVLLNVFPNHLDRHKSMRNYRKIKLQLFSRMTEGDVGIIPEEMMNSNGRPLFESRHNRWISFGTSDAADFRYVNGMVVWKDGMVSLRRTIFENEALGTSAAAAAAAVDACGLNCSHVESAARRFRPLPHRICDIGVLNGVRFVDDSKSTNMSAVVAALKAVRAPVYLIAGGRSKADDYERVRPLIAEKVVRAYLIGEAAETMHAAWSDSVSCLICRTLQNAVEAAFDSALPGSTILLSPGCSSADQFRDYRMRGKVFEECMAGLKKESKKKT